MTVSGQVDRAGSSVMTFLRTSAWGRLIPLLIMAVLGVLALRNFALLAQDMVTGNGAAVYLLPSTVYPLARVPLMPQTQAHEAQGRLGADFAQVYFPAQDIPHLLNAFTPSETLDPWHRPSRYAPLVILACAATVCGLPFGWASFAHVLAQLLVLALALNMVASAWGLRRYVLPSLFFVSGCLFLTPVGLSWFERGQFSLYIASSHMLLLFGLIEKRWAPVALAAALAFIKWTSFPASAVILAVYLLGSRDSGRLSERLALVAVFGAVIGLLILAPVLFVRGTGVYLGGLLEQELRGDATGLSLMKLLPPLAVKLLPLVLLLAGAINLRMHKGDLTGMIPYFIGAAAALLIYPTRAYDYSLSTLTGFIPAALVWAQRSRLRRPIAILVLAAFATFLVVGSYSTYVAGSMQPTVAIYVVFAIVFVALPSILAPFSRNGAPRGALA